MFSIIVSIPLFDYSTYWTWTDSYVTGSNILAENYSFSPDEFKFYLNEFIKFHANVNGQLLGTVAMNDKMVYEELDTDDYRLEELAVYQSNNND
jgi:hypothetical protein